MAKILAGFALGTAVGLAMSAWCAPETVKRVLPFVSPFGAALVAMLKMVVYPVILFSLIIGAASLPLGRSGKVGALVMAWYTGTSFFATVFGVAMAYMMNPSMEAAEKLAGAGVEGAKALAAGGAGASFGAFVVGLFQNPFAALANGQFLPIIVFAIAFGLAARWILDNESTTDATRRAVTALIDVCDGAQKISFRLIDCVVAYFPFGVAALTLVNFAENGALLFGPYARIVVCVTVGVVAMVFVVYPLLIAVSCRENPYRTLLRLRQPILAAFVTRSSAATLPMSFKAMDDIGVSRTLSSFSLPMGATVNMDGVCVHLPVFVILAANMFGHSLGVLDVATMCIMIMFASVGAGGVPGGSVFLLFMALENMGLSPEQVSLVVALALGINPVLDMFETSCNVAGDNVCTYIIAKKCGLLVDSAPHGVVRC
jgi:Na+/H+-dicarboxylate symporter